MLTHPLRSRRRSPIFAAAAIVTLALGIGAVAAALAIVYGVLLAPLPYGHPDRLVSVGLGRGAPTSAASSSPPPSISPIGAWPAASRASGSIAPQRQPLHRRRPLRSAAGDRHLGDRVDHPAAPGPPMLGRAFTEDEDRTGGPNVVLIAESVWRTQFGAAPDVLGRTLMVNSVPREIIGVMPARFMIPAADTRVWLPARVDRDVTSMADFSYWGVARLSPFATAEGATRELAAVLPRLDEEFPRLESGSTTASWLDEARRRPGDS